MSEPNFAHWRAVSLKPLATSGLPLLVLAVFHPADRQRVEHRAAQVSERGLAARRELAAQHLAQHLAVARPVDERLAAGRHHRGLQRRGVAVGHA